MNNRNKSYLVGNMLLGNMTASEVKKLDRIMNPHESEKRVSITLRDYIERFNPVVRRWTSKSGNAMVDVEILSDKIETHMSKISQQEDHLDTVRVYLKNDSVLDA